MWFLWDSGVLSRLYTELGQSQTVSLNLRCEEEVELLDFCSQEAPNLPTSLPEQRVAPPVLHGQVPVAGFRDKAGVEQGARLFTAQ